MMTYMQKGGRPPKPAGQETVGGLQQMIQQVGDDPELQEDIAEVGSMPGGMELLFTTAAEEMMKAQGLSKGEGTKEQKAKQIRLYNLGGSVDYNEGGLAAATNQGDDDILLHVSPEEYEAITAMWGEPDINSKTGIPEYGFLSKIWKKVKKTVKKIVKSQLFQMIAPIALNFFAPGLGVAVGGWLGASGAAAGIVGNAVVGGAIGAAGGGKEGALMGAIGGAAAGGAGTKVGKSIGLTGKSASVVGEALMTGVGAEATGGDFMQGAISGGIQAGITRPMVTSGLEKFKQIGEEGIKSAFTKAPGTPDPALGVKAPPPHTLEVRDISGNIVQGPPDVFAADKTNLMDMAEKYALPALMMGAAGSGGGGYEGAEGPPPLPEGWGDPLPQLSFNREQYTPGGDYYTYGQAGSPLQGEQQFFSENVIPSTQLAEGAAAGAVPPGPAVGGVAQAPVPINHPYAQQYLQQGWTRSPDGQMLLPPQQPPPFPALVAKGGLMRAHLQRGGRPALGRPGAQGRMSPQQLHQYWMLNPGKMPPGGTITGGGPAAGPTAGSTTGIGTPYIGYGGAWGIPPGGYGAGTAAAAPGAGLAPPQNATQIQPVGPPQAGPGQESGRDLDDLYSGGYQTTPHGYETYPGGYVAPSGPAPGAPGAPAPSPGAPAPSAPITQAPTGATIAQMFGDRYAASEPIAGAAVMPYLQEQGGGVMGDDPVDMSTYTRSGPYGRMFTDAMEQGLRTSGYIEDPQSRIWYPWEPYARGGYVNGYQRGGEFDYWEQNEDALRVASGKGGYHPDGEWRGHGLSRGPGSGRSDEIPAQLSDGEYVMDAETVALLGDGSTDAGAQRLDEMRQNLRKHKSKNLRRGDHSQDAKKPSRYMAKGGKVAPGQMRKIAKEEVKDHEYRKPPAGHGLRKRMKKQRGGSVNEVVGAMNREIEWRV